MKTENWVRSCVRVRACGVCVSARGVCVSERECVCVCACMIEPQEERGSQSTVRGGESEGGGGR